MMCMNNTTVSKGVFSDLPKEYQHIPVTDYSGKLLIPGLVDLHMHAPQYSFVGTGMDMELLEQSGMKTYVGKVNMVQSNLHYYFKTKDDLLFALQEKVLKKCIDFRKQDQRKAAHTLDAQIDVLIN